MQRAILLRRSGAAGQAVVYTVSALLLVQWLAECRERIAAPAIARLAPSCTRPSIARRCLATTPDIPSTSVPSATTSAPAAPRVRSPKAKSGGKVSWAALKGMHDYLPHAVGRQRAMETLFAKVCATFTYAEVRTPLLERCDLFARTLGEASDVVSKEMFSFDDHGTNTVLRPEATASVARALIATGIDTLVMPTRLFYTGPMFRRERPQAGRQRQFAQFGVELVGAAETHADVEVIQAAAECLREAGLLPYVKLQLNSLGDAASRAAYVKALELFLRTHESQLSEDSRLRLERGSVLRILDSKDAKDQAILRGSTTSAPAPILVDYLNSASASRFQELKLRLQDAGVVYELNPFLVRGLDYYQHACFEFVLDPTKLAARFAQLGRIDAKVPAQSTVLAGGRYDGLFETLGGPSVPAVGWAAGLDRLLLLQDMVAATPMRLPAPTPIGIVMIDDATTNATTSNTATSDAPSIAAAHAALCTYLRRGCQLPSTTAAAAATDSPALLLTAASPYSVVRSFYAAMPKQMKYCARSGLLDFGPATPQVQIILLVGPDEVRLNQVTVQQLRLSMDQPKIPPVTLPLAQLSRHLALLTSAAQPTSEANVGALADDLTYAALCQVQSS